MGDDNISQDLLLEIGKAIGQLNETNSSVKTLSEDLKKYIESHELSRIKCVENNEKQFKRITKKIDNHISVDHAENIKFMNWLMTIKKNALYVIIGLAGILFMSIAPAGIMDGAYRVIQFIRQLI